MAVSLDYDDSNLQKLIASLEPKRRLRAIRSGIRKEAKRVQKLAIGRLKSSGLRAGDGMEKGIRALTFKKRAGFRVTAKARGANRRGKGEAGMYTNRYGKKKPVLHFAESGTDERKTRGSVGLIKSLMIGRKRRKSLRAAHSTGRMKAYEFMAPAVDFTGTKSVENVKVLVFEELTKTAKKYGCK
ncbi:MAG: hypothetical protein IJ426_02605 [Clostridia bacterium]|nr:hypothetical protein [Clostridia bacterium]